MASDTEHREKTVVLNPVSGSGDHVDALRKRALLDGYDLVKTEEAGDAVDLARDTVESGSTLIAAAGGDGTLNEVVRGVVAADGLDRVTVGVIPVGTGNNFAGNIGVTGIDEAFDVLKNGDRRRIDLGVADGRYFVNSCISGLTADVSGETTPELKNRFGVVAYVINTFQTVSDFDGLRLSVDIWGEAGRELAWSGSAICVLVGNGRRFSLHGNSQADMEDGLFDVTIVEDAPTSDLVGEALLERLIGSEATHTIRLHAPSLELAGLEADPISFSLDGEIVETRQLSLEVREGVLSVAVGDGYEPDPDHAEPSSET
jgi:YegS/Rv2252/BmrU family lipid kinase